MSYTLTIDAPEKVTSYVARRGPRFKASLESMFVAFVTMEMEHDGLDGRSGLASARAEASGSAFAHAWGKIGVADGELDLSRPNEKLREVNFA